MKRNFFILLILSTIILIIGLFYSKNNSKNNTNTNTNSKNNTINSKQSVYLKTFIKNKQRGINIGKEKEYYIVKKYYNQYLIGLITKKQIINKIKELKKAHNSYDINYMLKKINVLLNN